jgi:putative phosphoribosyl transferase
MLFQDRTDAGRKLARALFRYKSHHPVILALPRGGVPVAAEVAATLECPLDLVLVRKIGVPSQPELAMGAVVDGDEPVVVRNEDVIRLSGVSEHAFDEICLSERAEIERRRRRYLGDRRQTDVKGRLVIMIDDGIATGATTLAAIKATRKRDPKQLVLAVPVAPLETIKKLHYEVDAVVCLETPEEFGAIGYYYRDFRQVDDAEVIAAMRRFPPTQLPEDRSLNGSDVQRTTAPTGLRS